MASGEAIDCRFEPLTWNSLVRIDPPELVKAYGFDVGSLVGLTYVDGAETAVSLGFPIGTRLVDVEGPNGDTVTVLFEQLSLIER